jgi:hypothetical protein
MKQFDSEKGRVNLENLESQFLGHVRDGYVALGDGEASLDTKHGEAKSSDSSSQNVVHKFHFENLPEELDIHPKFSIRAFPCLSSGRLFWRGFLPSRSVLLSKHGKK